MTIRDRFLAQQTFKKMTMPQLRFQAKMFRLNAEKTGDQHSAGLARLAADELTRRSK